MSGVDCQQVAVSLFALSSSTLLYDDDDDVLRYIEFL